MYPFPTQNQLALLDALLDEACEPIAITRVELCILNPHTLRLTIGTVRDHVAWSGDASPSQLRELLFGIEFLLEGEFLPARN
jgi:hypothetical protein